MIFSAELVLTVLTFPAELVLTVMMFLAAELVLTVLIFPAELVPAVNALGQERGADEEAQAATELQV